MATSSDTKVALISGHTDLTQSDFDRIYIPLINAALTDNHSFILGDATGADSQALTYLLSPEIQTLHPSIKSRITVYASRPYNIPKLTALGLTVIGPNDTRLTPTPSVTKWIGIENSGANKARYRHLVRDTYMTQASDYDILYVRSEEEARGMYGERYRARVSATELNRVRREKMAEETLRK